MPKQAKRRQALQARQPSEAGLRVPLYTALARRALGPASVCQSQLPRQRKFLSNPITFCFLAIIYAALTTLRQTDLKKIIAYSSIGHMNVAIVGLFSFDVISVAGSVILMVGHGLVSPALFISIGVLYDRFKTRLCRYYSGVALAMPLFATMLFVFTLANLSLPSTVNFVGEFLVFQGTFEHNPFAAVVIATSLVTVGAYSLFVCARTSFGVPKPAVVEMCDLSRREFYICFPFSFCSSRHPANERPWQDDPAWMWETRKQPTVVGKSPKGACPRWPTLL